MWIANKKQTIKRKNTYTQVFAGDPVPEASTWPNLKAFVRQGFVFWKDDDKPVIDIEIDLGVENGLELQRSASE